MDKNNTKNTRQGRTENVDQSYISEQSKLEELEMNINSHLDIITNLQHSLCEYENKVIELMRESREREEILANLGD